MSLENRKPCDSVETCSAGNPEQRQLMREALIAVQDAMLTGDVMLTGGDGMVGDFGWNITKLNKARPLIREALS